MTWFTVNNIGLVILAYLLGSIPTAVWVGKRFYNIDVREHGSGNAGATNTIRVLGKKAGIPVLLVDVLKGFLAVSLVRFASVNLESEAYVNYQLLLGVFVVVGHIFPVFASFRGGKGIATILGVVIALHPLAASISFVVFVFVLLMFGFVSLGSITAAVVFPLLIIKVFDEPNITLNIFSALVAVMVIITHRKNIGRLLKREEPKARIIKKNNDNKA